MEKAISPPKPLATEEFKKEIKDALSVEVGTDLIVNSYSALEKFAKQCSEIDNQMKPLRTSLKALAQKGLETQKELSRFSNALNTMFAVRNQVIHQQLEPTTKRIAEFREAMEEISKAITHVVGKTMINTKTQRMV